MIENNFKIKGFAVWLICAVFFMYEFLLRTVMGTFQNQIMSDLSLSAVQFSLLSTTIFLLIYGVMQIPAGILVEKFGLKKTLFVASLICGLSAMAFSYSNGFIWALSCRMLMGFGASFGFICLLMAVSDWMPHQFFAVFIGLSQFIGTMGPMISAGPLTSLSHNSDVTWNAFFFFFGLIGIALSLLVFFFVENNQHCSGKYIVLEKPEKTLVSLRKLFGRAQPWLIALTGTCMYFAIEYLSENEGRIFLSLKGLSLQSASNMLTISWVGYAIGCPLVGVISDYQERRKQVLVVSSAIGALATAMIVLVSDHGFLIAGFFLLGVGASGMSIGFAMIGEQFKPQFVAVGFGLVNALIMSISAINAPILGFLLEHLSGGAHPSLQNYTHAFYVLIAIATLGFVSAVLFVKETFCKSAVDFTFLKTKG